MTHEEYLNKRGALIAASQKLINEGKLEEFKAKKTEVENLDNEYSAAVQARKDLTLMEDKTIVKDLQNTPTILVTGNTIDSITNTTTDNAELQNTAFAKFLLNRDMNADEKGAFDLMNAAQVRKDHEAVIPETYLKGIWTEMKELHPILADTAETFIPGDVVITIGNVSNNASWYDEETEVTTDDVTTGEITLKGYELAKGVTVSWLLQAMSIEEFIPYITSKLAEVMGNALANSIINGKGVPSEGDTSFKAQPKGIVTALKAKAGTPRIITYSDEEPLTYKKLTSVVALIKSGYLSGAAIYAKNKTIWNELANLLDDIGRPLFIPDVTTGGVGRMFGLTVKEEDGVKDGDFMISNVKKGYAMNINKNIAIFTEEHTKKRETDYIGYAIADGAPITDNASAYIMKKND